jgi:hypothetical protein
LAYLALKQIEYGRLEVLVLLRMLGLHEPLLPDILFLPWASSMRESPPKALRSLEECMEAPRFQDVSVSWAVLQDRSKSFADLHETSKEQKRTRVYDF